MGAEELKVRREGEVGAGKRLDQMGAEELKVRREMG